MLLKKSFEVIFKNKGFSALVVLFDVLFVFCLGFFTGPVRVRMAELATIISAFMFEILESLEKITVSGLFFSSQVRTFTFQLLFYVLFFYLLVFVIFVVFQVFSWWFAFRIFGFVSFKKFFFKFLKISLFWFPFLIVLHFLSFVVDLRFEILQSFNSGGFNFLGVFLIVLIFFVFVAVFFSFLLFDVKALFKVGLKKVFYVIGFSLLILFLSRIVPFFVSKVSFGVALVVSFLLTFLGFLFIRVFAIQVLKEKIKIKKFNS